MALPNFRINQPGGGGTGTLNTARPYGLRQGVAVNLVTTETGPYTWEIEAAPPGSSATLSNANSATATITPDVANLPWRIRLTTGSGVSAKTRVFVFGADLDSGGVEVGSGLMPPAYGEKEGEDNSTSRGYAARVENIVNTLHTLATESGGTGAVIYDEGALSPVAPTYSTFDDAYAAAVALVDASGGPVDLVMVVNNDPPEFPAGNWDLKRRIRIRMVAPTDLALPQPVTVVSGAVLRNAVYFEGIEFDGNLSTYLFTSTSSIPLDITFRRCTHDGTGNTSAMAELKTGTNRFIFEEECNFSFDTEHFTVLSSGKNVYARAEGGSLLNAESFGGSAGTLTSVEGAGSTIEEQASFSGTNNAASAVLDSLSRATYAVSVNGQRVSSVADPVTDNDAANKAYVDAVAQGLQIKASVRAATTADITLSGTQTIDGVSVIANDRVLVKNQSTGSQNGIYVCAAGAWSRSSDANTDAEVTSGIFAFVEEGTTYADSGWVLSTNDPITVGVTSLTFTQFSGAGQITAGFGLNKTGNELEVDQGEVVDATAVQTAMAAASAPFEFNSQPLQGVGAPTDSTDGDTLGSRNQAIQDAALRLFRYVAIAGTQDNDTTDWVTIGCVTVDPTLLKDPPGLTRAYSLRSDLQITEASPGTVTAEVRLLDSSLTSLGTAASTLSGATTFPQHCSVSLTAGNSNGQLRSTATTYLIQLRRQNGSSGDRVFCHNAHIEVRWS